MVNVHVASEQRRKVQSEKNFHSHFSVAWMGCCSTFVLCTALPLLSGLRAIRDRLHDTRNAL